MSVNKRKIIDKIIKAKPKSYENIERLLTLARNLNFDSDDKSALEVDVLNCSVNAALQVSLHRDRPLTTVFWPAIVHHDGRYLIAVQRLRVVLDDGLEVDREQETMLEYL